MKPLFLLHAMSRAGVLVLVLLLAGCVSGDEPTPQEDPFAGQTESAHEVRYNLTEPGNFSLRVEMRLAAAEGNCLVNSTLMGTATPHNVHQVLYLDQAGKFSGVMVGYAQGPEAYVRPGAGEPVVGEGSSAEWFNRMGLGHQVSARSYNVTMYGFNVAPSPEGAALHVTCDSAIEIVNVSGSSQPGGLTTLVPGPNTVSTAHGGATWARSQTFSIEAGVPRFHGLVDDMYGSISLTGPGLTYERTYQGTPSHPHLAGSIGEYTWQAPAMATDEKGFFVFAYAGFEPLPLEYVETS